jgi:hypothetical protein
MCAPTSAMNSGRKTIVWFLSLLPTDAQVVCMTEAVPQPIPMPRQADTEQIAAVLESLDN